MKFYLVNERAEPVGQVEILDDYVEVIEHNYRSFVITPAVHNPSGRALKLHSFNLNVIPAVETSKGDTCSDTSSTTTTETASFKQLLSSAKRLFSRRQTP